MRLIVVQIVPLNQFVLNHVYDENVIIKKNAMIQHAFLLAIQEDVRLIAVPKQQIMTARTSN